MKKLLTFALTLTLLALTVCPGVTAFAASDTQSTMSLGSIENGIYSNEYAGIACALNDNWVYASAQELQDLPDNISELFADTELADQVADSTVFVDMRAENTEEMLSININFIKLGMIERLQAALLSEEEFVDGTLQTQKDMLISAYAQAGILVSSMEKVTVTFLGEEHFALKTQVVLHTEYGIDIPAFFLQITNYKLGSYGMTLTVSSYVEDNTQSMLDLFYALD